MNPIVVEDEEYLGKARIYHRYRIRGLISPTGRSPVKAVHQQALPFVSPQEVRDLADKLTTPVDDEADELLQHKLRQMAMQEAAEQESSLTFLSDTRYPGYEEWLARHEDSTRAVFRLFHTDFPNPKQVHPFRAFRSVAADPDIFLFNAPGSLVDSFLRRLAESHPDAEIMYPHLDLQSLVDEGTTHIRGGSFSIRNRPNLTTAMVFGPGVNEDDAWEEYSRVGQLTYVQMQLALETSDVRMMVTRRGSLLPYGIDDIAEELRLCREVYDRYLKRFEQSEVALNKRKRRR